MKADEMRISDWSSDVCSSDLRIARFLGHEVLNDRPEFDVVQDDVVRLAHAGHHYVDFCFAQQAPLGVTESHRDRPQLPFDLLAAYRMLNDTVVDAPEGIKPGLAVANWSIILGVRSDARRVGKGGVSRSRSRRV